MGAFLSGTDWDTIRAEGNDTNCFVSLVVDTKGTYVAAVTRKMQTKKEVTTKHLGTSYQFFGEGEIQLGGDQESKQNVVSTTAIESYMLNVEIEHVENALEYLDTRFEEIKTKKQQYPLSVFSGNAVSITSVSTPPDTHGKMLGTGENDDMSFQDYMSYKQNNQNIAQIPEELSLFSHGEMEEATDISKWQPNPVLIHDLVCKMVCCSFILDTKRLDLKQWIVRNMVTKYKNVFGANLDNEPQFQDWKEFIVDFIVNQYNEPDTPSDLYDDFEIYQSKVAGALYDELKQYPSNEYIESYKEVLIRYMYE